MNCPNCGAYSEDGAKFCMNCGTPLEASSQPTQVMPATDQPTQAIPPTDQPTQAMPAQDAVAYQATQAMPAQHTAAYQATQPMPPQPGAPVPPPGMPVQPGAPMPPQAPQSNGKAIGALICGIAAIVLSSTVIFGIILGIIAIVLGVSAFKQTSDGKAKAGKICGIIGIVLSVMMLIACIATGFAIVKFIEDNPDEFTYVYSAIDSSSSDSSSSKSSASSSSKSSSSSSSASSSSSKSTSANTYENKRFGYSLKLPSGFTMTSESANGDGANFESSALNMKVMTFGKNNTNGLTPEQLMETWWQGSPDTTKEIGDNYVLFTQVEGNLMHFYFAYVGAGSIDQMEIVYPENSDSSKQLDVAEQLVNGFQVGNIASTC